MYLLFKEINVNYFLSSKLNSCKLFFTVLTSNIELCETSKICRCS